MLYTLIIQFLILIFKIVFRIKVYGKKNIPKVGGFILASNHVSYLDPITLGVACPRKLNFMARHDLFCNPLFSWFITILGAFPLKRDSYDSSALKEAIRRLKNGNALVLFPEGSRSINGISNEPQPGIGFLVVKACVPVIPAFIRGTELVLPKGSKFIRLKTICVYFGKPRTFLYDEKLSRDRKAEGRQVSIERRLPYQSIARTIMEDIRHLSCYPS